MGKEKTAQERCRESVPALLQWYAYNARVLPWRENPTPYHVWISEIMLQQTRVEAVRGYYDRFLADLPTVRAVAEAQEDRLIKLWEGLGYYSRVRNIGKAAKVICERYDGELPADYALLRELPGIGDYTAGAIASIAYGQCVPAVDGNVLRVYARLTAYRDDIRSESFKKQVRELLTDAMEKQLLTANRDDALSETVLSETRVAGKQNNGTVLSEPSDGSAGGIACVNHTGSVAGQFNQAVMDIGATVCIPNGKPHCDVCPLAHLCKAYAEDLTGEIPKKAEKKARPVQKKTVMVIRCNGRILLHRRPQTGLLAGMWELPNVDGHLSSAEVKKAAAEILSKDVKRKEAASFAKIGTRKEMRESDLMTDVKEEAEKNTGIKLSAHRFDDSRHVFSHVEWEMRGYRIDVTTVAEDGTASVDSTGKISLPELVGPTAETAENPATQEECYIWLTSEEIAETVGLPQAFHAYKLQL